MVPKGWKLTSLNNICENNLQTGPFGSQLHAKEYVSIGIAVLMPKDLINNKANTKLAAKITQEKALELKRHCLKNGDLLFSRRGDVSRFALIDKKSEGAICGTGCLRARPSSKHSSNFIAYLLQRSSVKKWLEKNAVGQTMPNINTEILGELPLISASSRQEEDKIVQILSTWDKAITTTEQLLANSQQQKKALMQQLLTGKKRLLDENGVRYGDEWKHSILKQLAQLSKGTQINKENLSKEGDYPVINGGITPSGYTSEYNVKKNTITISEGGNSCGHVALQFSNFWCGGHCYALEMPNINFIFLYQVLKLNQPQIMRLRVGSGLPNIQKKSLESLVIQYPIDSKEQHKIAAVLSAADKEITVLQQKLDMLKQEKKALMQQLLTGKRRVKIEEAA